MWCEAEGEEGLAELFQFQKLQFCPVPSSTRDINSNGKNGPWASGTHLPQHQPHTRGQRTRWKKRSGCAVLLLFVLRSLLINLPIQSHEMSPVKLNSLSWQLGNKAEDQLLAVDFTQNYAGPWCKNWHRPIFLFKNNTRLHYIFKGPAFLFYCTRCVWLLFPLIWLKWTDNFIFIVNSLPFPTEEFKLIQNIL